MNSSITAIDLFCGIGGMTHGLIKAGIPVYAGVDNDKKCRYAYVKNNRTLFINKDINEISGSTLEKLYPERGIKVLVGCAPCQPFSCYTQKKENRKKDVRWKLLYSFTRLIKEVTPEIVSMENVPQIVKHKVFTDFVKDLKSLGKLQRTYYYTFRLIVRQGRSLTNARNKYCHSQYPFFSCLFS